MRIMLSIFSFNILISFAFLLFPQINVFSQESKESNQLSTENPIIIHSDTLELDQEKKLVVFEGKVKAKTESMVIDCQKMFVYYLGNPTEKETDAESNRIDKIIAIGNVIINRFAAGMAQAGKAVFYQNEEKIVLTENPVVQQGPDYVEGKRIIIFLNESRSIVEGNEKKRVKATIFPKGGKGK